MFAAPPTDTRRRRASPVSRLARSRRGHVRPAGFEAPVRRPDRRRDDVRFGRPGRVENGV